MEPIYKMGSSVLVWKTRRVRVGDVVAFIWHPTDDGTSNVPSSEKKVLIKRISKQVGNDTFEVAGDNKADSLDVRPVDRDEIIGRVVLSY